MISKYKQSDWFSRFLVMLSQHAQDFGRNVPDPYPSWRWGLGTRLFNEGHDYLLIFFYDAILQKQKKQGFDRAPDLRADGVWLNELTN